ncbi:transcription antitermination factor NusB [Flavisolibacter nicotianae]|uniref:transcription antitermination factor NusB n=1 Tax=Flavisolibacter nicotianae TaxID=2364882 RepID=UPI000EB0C5E2|nr:transcription antitermination factor NusB [Flavisolibacter nicotianae]
MISRRNIRVKVMQTIYTLSTLDHQLKPGEPVKALQKHFDQSKDLLLYLSFFLTEVAGYAEKDSYQRRSKHLPSAEDLNVNTKIAGNELLWKIKEDLSFRQEVERSKPEHRIDKDLVRKIYQQLTESAEYKQYISSNERNGKSEKEILDFIFRDLMLQNDSFISHIEENFINWDDDGDMVIQTLDDLLQKPGSVNFSQTLPADKWDFAKSLLTTVLEKGEHLESFIIPRLKNWDPERIAALDMIIMKMGVAEFLYFETIPPKVTINEYIDISKEYSTQQSGQFVNGILDNIHKELIRTNQLQKSDFKKA